MQSNYSMLQGLNPEQYKAVTYSDGSLLVLAGAGSGKTRVLTTRLAWLVKSGYLGVSEVLAVTFTNKAAREMLHRVGKLLETDTKYMWVGTFHSIGVRLLRAHYQEAGLPASFQIIDSGEQQSLIKRLIKQKGFDEEHYPAKEIQSYINNLKEQGLRSAQLNPEGLRNKHWIQIYTNYEEVCNRDGLVDFTELLLRSYELLSMHDGILRRYQQQFKHILVDEFQDTNHLQYLWLKLLVGQNASIFAVGDDDQSIYSFRGAKVSNMRTFLRDFNAPEPLRLEQNYRSTPTILAAANAIIDNNSDRIGKNLWTDSNKEEKIRLYEGYTEEDEAYFVIDEIKGLHNGGVDLADMAILYRSNAQSRVFEQHLYNRGISYKVYGGLRFFDRLEIKRVLSYLRLIVNPYDNEAFIRVVNFPARGIGPKSIENLQELAAINQVSLFEAVDFLPGKSKITVNKFNDLIRMMQVESKVLNLPEIISYIIEVSGMRTHFETEKKEDEERLANLNELVTSVANFKSDAESNQLVEFLAHAVLESVDNQAQNFESAVQLMTVHAAKGLEFKVVFVVGLEDGLFPHDNASKSEKDVEEERRLMYVAVTRAREKLYLMRACSRLLWGKRMSAPISRFVNEIPEDLIMNISGVSSIGYSQLSEYDSYSPRAANNEFKSISNPESKTSRVVIRDQDLTVKIGDMVRHAKFGQGKILRLNEDGKKMTADIFFIGVGKKTLDLNIAKIEKVY